MDFDQSSKRIFLLVKTDNKIYSMHFAGAGSFGIRSALPADGSLEHSAAPTSRSTTPRAPPPKTSTTRPTAIRSSDTPRPARRCRHSCRKPARSAGSGVDNEGHLWTGNFNNKTIEEFEPTGGAPIKTVDVSGTGAPCRVRFDLSNNDMYVPQYGGQGAVRYTAASGYAPGSAQVFDTTTNATVAINATRHVVYIAGSSKVSAYDTATGSLLETFGEEVGCSINGVAVDDATDTVFLSRGCTNRVQEWKGTLVPDALTGEPTGNSQVSGSVALAGGGEVISCKFEFGETTEYGQSKPCNPAAPFTSDQALVTAELKDDLEGEKTYHYRLVASNANGTAKGVDKTITPHNVKNITTGLASEITADSALVSGTFEGNGEQTTYYFEYGRTTSYGRKVPIPPSDAGAPTGRHGSPDRADRTRPGRHLPLSGGGHQWLRDLKSAG